ncbi:uncharacterized protein LOC135715503 [Ochlerotatus camptorhynchus]|uniref:uncharacterized protein LOC135715034 n=1 Tax=Ochlerotatus camptorhynchus TaxID=644619 RepID=UPI0031DA822F
METSDHQEQTVLEIPSFCEHYEPLLVEEVTLASHPTSVHYGKCAIIGYLRERSNCLESLMVPGLSQELQIPDSSWSLQLCFDNYFGQVPRNCCVRIYGSVQLRGPSDSSFNSSKDLICYLLDLQDDAKRQNMNVADTANRIQEAKQSMANNYIPILDVQGCERVEQARELIGCNLRLKRINKRLAPWIQLIEREIYNF